MSQSLAQVLVHLVFSTRNREAWLVDEIREDLHAYIGGIVDLHKGVLLKAGSMPDHIHLLMAHPRTCAPADLVQEIKTGSSKWLKTRGTRFAGFHWQSGYGLFSISPSHRAALERYIGDQAAHHRRFSFQERQGQRASGATSVRGNERQGQQAPGATSAGGTERPRRRMR